MTKYNASIYGYYLNKEEAMRKLEEVNTSTDFVYSVRKFDDMSWFLWREAEKDVKNSEDSIPD